MASQRKSTMLKRAMIVIFCILSMAVSRAENSGMPTGATGVFDDIVFMGPAGRSDLRVHVPDSYRSDRPIGILWGFRGGGVRHASVPPYTKFLLDSGFEAVDAEQYWISVSLAMPVGFWSAQVEAQNIAAFTDYLKTKYAIDSDRFFCVGHSSGGTECLGLLNSLKNYFAAVGPTVPFSGSFPDDQSKSACISCGGRDDIYPSATIMAQQAAWYRQHNLDGNFYIADMGHETMPDDETLTPSLHWPDKILEYLANHPKGFASKPHTPAQLIASMEDGFDSGTRLDGSRWRTELFDESGILYGSTNKLGSVAVGMHGYQLKPENGYLVSSAIGTGHNGGIATTRFVLRPASWESSFVLQTTTTAMTVWPALLRDTTGRVLSLNIEDAQWRWRLSFTHLAFRSNQDNLAQTLSSGSFAGRMNVEYRVKVDFYVDQLIWSITLDGNQVAGGSLNSEAMAGDAVEFGLGLKGSDAAVKFGHAAILAAPNAARDWWMLY